jgi:hypothetical protein
MYILFLHNIIMSSIRALTLPIPQAHFIWYCAWLSIPSAIYAYSHPTTTHFAPIPAAVFATSLLYWRNPLRDSWRRKLDIIVVSAGLTHHMYYALYHPTPHTPTYLALIGVSMMSYTISQYYSDRQQYWPAAYAHAMIHLVANIANFVLYYGIK